MGKAVDTNSVDEDGFPLFRPWVCSPINRSCILGDNRSFKLTYFLCFRLRVPGFRFGTMPSTQHGNKAGRSISTKAT